MCAALKIARGAYCRHNTICHITAKLLDEMRNIRNILLHVNTVILTVNIYVWLTAERGTSKITPIVIPIINGNALFRLRPKGRNSR